MLVIYLIIIIFNTQLSNETKFIDKLKSDVVLYEPASFKNFNLDINSLILNETIDGNYYLILNKSLTKYLKAYQYAGDVNYSISLFEVGIIINSDKAHYSKLNYVVTEDDDNFETQCGLKLGLNRKEVERVIGDFLVKKDDYFYNEIINSENLNLKKYNMPKYILEIFFDNNYVVKFTFGFEYP